MTSMMLAGVGLLVLVAVAFMVLWIADAHRADRIAADPERVPRWRRWSRSLGYPMNKAEGKQ